ncbi:hypothetical protein BV349_01632 [Pseudomonas syringae pv. actinidiae]|uniref:DUF2523 family protein n=1 Tax=Pseudomonas syringae TaxID=317 RepID=UPI000A1DDB36|nr:DUF2523 family protein [Pseudomonas syringae]OSN67627.1 hypothetical protein BV349_01621 [Pseudomonas syringae pv. actinidiae]OSN67638.1 hypothetical protein BV349_01632 [Pseudomonas syringae pv. actinidiae]OSN68359.1 hypothetical protein BV351_05373 [Pseudomonas syringae pv. actinidiae]
MSQIISTIASWFAAVLAWFGRIFEWLAGIFIDFMAFLADLPLQIFGGFLDGVIYLLNKIPVPGFLTQYSLQTLFNSLPDTVLYFVSLFGIPQAIGILGLGVAFRLTRKALTLGQW